MTAGEDGVKSNAFGIKQFFQPRRDSVIVLPAVEAATNAGLIGDHNQCEASSTKAPQRPDDTVDQSHVVGVGDVAWIFNDRSIAIKEKGWTTAHRRLGEGDAVRRFGQGSIRIGKCRVDSGTKEVTEQDMHLLDSRRVVAWDDQTVIGQFLRRDPAAVAAGEAGGHQPRASCRLQRRNNVRRVAGRRQANEEVAAVTDCRHLAGEDMVEAEIVCGRRQGRCIGGQCHRW